MLKVGLMGGIGTGKSTVARIFGMLNIPIYEADKAAKWLCQHHEALKAQLKQLLRSESYTTAGLYDSAYVAQRVYSDPSLLIQINALVHPLVKIHFEHWLTSHHTAPYIIREAALLSGSKNLDKIIWVNAPLELRLQRIKSRDPHRSQEQIEKIMQNQASEHEFMAIADYTIENDETHPLIEQVLALHQTLLTF